MTKPHKIIENGKIKLLVSDECNYLFDKKNGFMATWGKTKDEDPDYSPHGPFILDIEISTVCKRACSFCYKSNTAKGTNMSFETFKDIFHKMPNKVLTQIAFGIGSLDGNPDLYKIMAYCRENDYNKVVPNVTINGSGLTDYHAKKLAHHCGAVAVSHYNSDVCYRAVKKLIDKNLERKVKVRRRRSI